MIKQFKLAAAAVALAGAFASTANAGGFLLTEQSALGLGRAYAGIGVDGTDISGIYFNPASMTLHSGTKFQMGGVYVDTNMEYKGDDGVTSENGRGTGEMIPHFFYTTEVTDSMRFGLGVTVPFGMSTNYNEDWAERTSGISSRILTIDVNPNLAWKINDKWSFGAGASIQYARASLKTGLALPGVGEIPGSYAQIKADSLNWGYNFGVMFTPVDNVRLGLSYRSQIRHDAEGDVSINGLPPQMAMLNKTVDGGATVTAPAWAMLNVAWDVNQTVSLYATLRWTDWSSFDQLQINAPEIETILQGLEQHAPFQKLPAIENQWKDTYLGTIGFDYRLNPTWTLRAGIGYETSPVDKEEYRMAIIPDTDRLWLSLGASYKLDDRFQFDIGFAHLRGVGDRDLYSHTTGKKVGEFDSLDAYLAGVQMQYNF